MRLPQRPRHIAGDEKRALAQHRIKVSVGVRQMQKVTALHLTAPRRKVDAVRIIARIPQELYCLAAARAHIEYACTRRQIGQRKHTAGVGLAARVPVHLSSSARSTEATLPRASSSGT